MQIVIAILAFCVIIIIHELGHFAAAKLCGIQVNEFALGMGPVIFRKRERKRNMLSGCYPSVVPAQWRAKATKAIIPGRSTASRYGRE